MSLSATSDLWWKNAVIYCLDVETFMDHDGDGCGDFAGLTERVDYLAGLGVTCIWLMPFYPSPDLDDGYDVTDYFGVDSRLGSLGDVVEFVRTATDRGIRVIADLIVNHTSDQHPWFQQARADRDSPLRDYYVWVDEPPEGGPDDLVFPDAEDSNWAYDEQAGQYYLHRFYSHQPDLNVGNPQVCDEIHKVIGFWLELGLSGFRIDAVPFFLEDIGIEHAVREDPHHYLRDLRAFTSRRRGDAMLLGEVNLEPSDLRRYFGGDHADQLHMLFNFVLNQALYLAIVREDAGAIRGTLQELPDIPQPAQWANFLRNHDELSLDKLTDEEREEVFAQLAPDEGMRLFGRGIRRRLPTMLGGDRRRIELCYSLLFSLPGTPVLFYGEEIGMGENLAVEGRMSVRTPMQWSDDRNGGFSAAPADQLCMPINDEGEFGYGEVNVEDQRRDAGSMLNWMERLIRLRKQMPEIGWGAFQVLDVGQPQVLAHRCDWGGTTVVALHNLSGQPVKVGIDLEDADQLGGFRVELGGGESPARIKASELEFELAGYGYRWLRTQTP